MSHQVSQSPSTGTGPGAAADRGRGDAVPGPIAYLTAIYPAASHTFIQREIAALQAAGVHVLPCSIRRPPPDHVIGAEERAAVAETFYVLEAAKAPLRLLGAHAAICLANPAGYVRAIALAVRTARPGITGAWKQLAYFLEAGVLARHLRRVQARHLHNHFMGASASVAMLASQMSGLPLSHTLHGPADLYEPHSWQLGEKIARATFTACISHFARSQAMLFSDPGHWGKLRVVHCGVDPARYAGGPPEPGDALRLLFVGRLAAVKGLRVLFRALERARAVRPGIELTLVGDGTERPWVEVEAARLGGITCLGYRSQDEVAEALQRCEAFVLPSFAEGVPVVLMEAMAASRPVIATRVGGVAELVEDGVSGLLVAPGDEEGLAAAILRLAADPALRGRMGAAGSARVRAEFDVAREARRLLSLYAGAGGTGVRPDPRPDPREAV